MEELYKNLENPPRKYRGIPFWSWNDKLDPEFLRWQIREMNKAGLGGFFMHARGGLQTEYMGEEWMKCVEACLDEGGKLGMNCWCYDEEGWPSGFAGGAVTALGDRYHVRWLEMKRPEEIVTEEKDRILGIYMLDETGCKLSRIHSVESAGNSGNAIIIVHNSNPYYIDILNDKVVNEFIKSTHEKYYSMFADRFGKDMPGFFTDEPQYAKGKIPWSYILPEKFSGKFGYDLLDFLPALFLKCEGCEKVRYDFWSLVNELYVTSFAKQIYDWCEKHNCKLTGHVMEEDSISSQMGATGGGMPFYEYMHIPGMDWLGRKIGSPVIPKQVSSVVCQLGKKFALSEMFALCGWDVSFEELKWVAEWQYVNGISLMCQHLEGYTLRGFRKRDFPPSLFFQQSWWKEYAAFNDYFARLGMLMTSGSSAVDILVLHPMRSGWIAYDGRKNDFLKRLDEDFVRLSQLLLDLHYDYHYGDETIIGKYGSVDEKEFVIGLCRYKAVIVPSMLTLDAHTVELLNIFADNGGAVISAGEFPALCGGSVDTGIDLLKEKVFHAGNDVDALDRVLKSLDVDVIRVTGENGEIGAIHYQQRKLESGRLFFLVNHDQKKAHTAEITVKGTERVRRYDVEKGMVEDMPYINCNGVTNFSLDFLPMQSHVILLDDDAPRALPKREQKVKILKTSKLWDIEHASLNSLTLDCCSYSIDGGDWAGPVPVIKLMNILLELKKSCDITLKFDFEVNMDMKKNSEFYAVLEKAEEFNIVVNGRQVEYRDIGWWKDSSFRKIDIKPFIKNGKNEILLKRCFFQKQKVYNVLFGKDVFETEKNKLTYDVELESIYLLGDFGVVSKSGYTEGERKSIYTDGPFVVVDRVEKVESGDLTRQGFCFFAGDIKLSQTFNVQSEAGARLVLKLDKPDAAMCRVYVNDKPVKLLMWAPYEADITDFVESGSNKLTIQLFGGNRNLLGPHHHVLGESYMVGPLSFTDKTGWYDAGLTDIWRDRYSFVRFGLKG